MIRQKSRQNEESEEMKIRKHDDRMKIGNGCC